MRILKKMTLILFSVLMVPASSGMNGKEESFDMKKELSSIMGYRYESVGDTETLDTGRIISRKTLDRKNRHESVTISGKKKDGKYASGNDASDIHSDVQYADENHISSIVTDSQRIDFSYDSDMHLTDVFLNDVRLFHRDEDDNSLVIGYANGDRSEFIRTGDSATYRDSLSEGMLNFNHPARNEKNT